MSRVIRVKIYLQYLHSLISLLQDLKKAMCA
jgi:hypothetical protein